MGFIARKAIYVHRHFVAWQLFSASDNHYAAPLQQIIEHWSTGIYIFMTVVVNKEFNDFFTLCFNKIPGEVRYLLFRSTGMRFRKTIENWSTLIYFKSKFSGL